MVSASGTIIQMNRSATAGVISVRASNCVCRVAILASIGGRKGDRLFKERTVARRGSPEEWAGRSARLFDVAGALHFAFRRRLRRRQRLIHGRRARQGRGELLPDRSADAL